MSKLGRTEKGILIIVSIVLVLFSYLLYDDSFLFKQESQSNKNSIGDISFSENDVRRKSNQNFSWLPANKKDFVFQEDSIYTGSESNAEITLADGSVIEIQPNSLVTISTSRNGQMNLNLSYGNMVGQLAKGSELTVQSGEEEFNLKGDNSKIQFNKSNAGKVDVNLISGNASVSTKSGKEVALKKVLAVMSPKLELITPAGTTISKFSDAETVPLQWKGNSVIAKYEIKVAKDPNFSNLISQDTTKNQKVNITKDLPGGKYYWQVVAFKKDGTVAVNSEVRDFSVSAFKSPEITSPQPQAVINLELPGKPEELLNNTKITWNSFNEYTQYRVQISKDADFKEVLKDIVTPAKDSMTPNLPSGTYHTRVLGVFPDKKISSQWSKPVSFTFNLVATKELPPVPPVLVSSKVYFKVPKKNDRTPAAIAGPVMAWKPVANIPKYRLQIAKNKEFTDTTEFDVNNTKAAWSQYRPGKYYYRVYSITASGLTSGPSETGEVGVISGSPVLSSIAPIQVRGKETPPPKDIKVTWSEVPFAKSYLLQYDQDENFSNPKQLQFTSTVGKIKLPTVGMYHIRVKAVDESNMDMSEYSNKELALYAYQNPLTTPILNEPFDKASIFLQKEATPYVWLEWKSVDGAQSYAIEISNTPDFSKVLVTKSVADNRFLISNQIPTGKIFWRVRAMSLESKSESDWSPQREFILFQKKNEIFVK